MLTLGVAFPIALVAVAVCAARGHVLRGLLAGLAIGLLAGVGLVVDLAVLLTPGSPGALVVMLVWPALQLVVMAVAISRQRERPARPRARRRRGPVAPKA